MTKQWQQYGAWLLMPLRTSGVFTLAFVAVGLTVLLKSGLFALPPALILATWYFKYSFAFLDAMVAGQREPPVLSVEMIMASLDEFRFLLPLILCIVAFFAFGAADYFVGTMLASLFGLVMLLVLPAMIAVQGWTGRLSHSLDPTIWVRMALTLGSDYACILPCVAALVIVCVLVGTMPAAPLILKVSVSLYAWLGTIAVIGGALQVNRDKLSESIPLIIPEIALPSSDAASRQRERWIDSMYGPLRANNRDNVWQLVTERLQSVAHPLSELQWLYERVAAWRPFPFPNRVAQEIIARLLAEGREGEALRMVRERLALDPSFRPLTADEARRLAQLAEHWRDEGTVDALKKAFPEAA